jgi:hypothetical protein
MRDVIRRERRTEMAFEEQRYWDIRRWKIGETVYNKPLRGMQITKNPDGTFTYKIIDVSTTVFTSRMYRYPIPYSEIIKNKNLQQNEGWN